MALLQLVLAVSLSAAPAELKVAQGSFRFVGLSEELRAFLPNHLAQRLQRPGIKVVTSSDVQNILGLERQRELLGCSESAGCTAELIGALGADGLLVGEIAKVGALMQVNLKILSGRSGETMASFSRRADDERKLLEVLDEGGDALAVQLLATRSEPASQRVLGAAFWVPAGLAVVALAGAGVGLGLASGEQAFLLQPHTPAVSYEEARAHANTGTTEQTLGFVGLGVGVVAAIGAGIAFALAPSSPTVAVSLGPGSAGIALGGTFP